MRAPPWARAWMGSNPPSLGTHRHNSLVSQDRGAFCPSAILPAARLVSCPHRPICPHSGQQPDCAHPQFGWHLAPSWVPMGVMVTLAQPRELVPREAACLLGLHVWPPPSSAPACLGCPPQWPKVPHHMSHSSLACHHRPHTPVHRVTERSPDLFWVPPDFPTGGWRWASGVGYHLLPPPD